MNPAFTLQSATPDSQLCSREMDTRIVSLVNVKMVVEQSRAVIQYPVGSFPYFLFWGVEIGRLIKSNLREVELELEPEENGVGGGETTSW